ncbi:MAG: 7-carboxy-7-deazaguanine synthase QueE [Bacteroidales bacterium]|nr:7-carboxy-7-deazaguanine synthase QueE [Bacteroidales bacterium]
MKEGKVLPVMEEFYSIQGEGVNSGKAAYFIRIGGCDVSCHWCDVKESWKAGLHPLKMVEDVVKRAGEFPAKAVVLTGGEPLLYNLEVLTTELRNNHIEIFLETSGSHPFTGKFDWVCLSPKKFKPPIPEAYKRADELKVIISNPGDFEWAEKNAQWVGNDCRLLLQAEWSQHEQMMPLIIEYVKKYPRWSISLQTHKFMRIP